MTAAVVGALGAAVVGVQVHGRSWAPARAAAEPRHRRRGARRRSRNVRFCRRRDSLRPRGQHRRGRPGSCGRTGRGAGGASSGGRAGPFPSVMVRRTVSSRRRGSSGCAAVVLAVGPPPGFGVRRRGRPGGRGARERIQVRTSRPASAGAVSWVRVLARRRLSQAACSGGRQPSGGPCRRAAVTRPKVRRSAGR